MIGSDHIRTRLTADLAIAAPSASRIKYAQACEFVKRHTRLGLKCGPVFVLVCHFILCPLSSKACQMLIARKSSDVFNKRTRFLTGEAIKSIASVYHPAPTRRATQRGDHF